MRKFPWWGYVLVLPFSVPVIVASGWVVERITEMPAQAEEKTEPTDLVTSGSISSGSIAVVQVRNDYYTFEPRPDITPYEVAQSLNLVMKALACRSRLPDCGFRADLEGMPQETKRHFVKHDN